MASTKSDVRIHAMVESAIMIALGVILSMIKLVDLPYGGSVTLASMFPIVVISYRWGLGWGMCSGLVFSVIELLTGLSTLSYVTTWQSVLAVVLLDYIIAYAVTGLGGILRKQIKNQSAALVLGVIIVCVLRYLCHVISGATVWAGISIPTAAALGYSIIYNATYMLPEMIIMIIVAAYLGSAVDFRAQVPTRMKRTENEPAKYGVLRIIGGLAAAAALIFDVSSVFAVLQNADTGEFDITQIGSANWVAIIAVTVVAACVVACTYALSKTGLGKSKKA
ncbi:MAG: energy-coupled thiamine transporter ThiT [Oscillospiraceae bacterium]|nr:energy-coupled thiamine transporter ThiT [Oscillospiraceae bacterium]